MELQYSTQLDTRHGDGDRMLTELAARKMDASIRQVLLPWPSHAFGAEAGNSSTILRAAAVAARMLFTLA